MGHGARATGVCRDETVRRTPCAEHDERAAYLPEETILFAPAGPVWIRAAAYPMQHNRLPQSGFVASRPEFFMGTTGDRRHAAKPTAGVLHLHRSDRGFRGRRRIGPADAAGRVHRRAADARVTARGCRRDRSGKRWPSAAAAGRRADARLRASARRRRMRVYCITAAPSCRPISRPTTA